MSSIGSSSSVAGDESGSSAMTTTTTTVFFNDKDAISCVMQFLGVKSLIHLGSTSTVLQSFFKIEVSRRKRIFASNRKQVKEILDGGSDTSVLVIEAVINREKILQAYKLYQESKVLIDHELNLLDRLDSYHLVNETFDLEHRQLTANPQAYPPEASSFYMLPLCFYIPPDRDLLTPTTAELNKAQLSVSWVCVEDHTYMDGVYRMGGRWIRIMPDPKHPLRIFEHPLACSFTKFAWNLSNSLRVDDRALDAFRVAAKDLALLCPASVHCLHYVLHNADEKDEDED